MIDVEDAVMKAIGAGAGMTGVGRGGGMTGVGAGGGTTEVDTGAGGGGITTADAGGNTPAGAGARTGTDGVMLAAEFMSTNGKLVLTIGVDG